MEGVAVNVAVVLGDAPVDNEAVILGVTEGDAEYEYPDVNESVALALADGATDVAAADGVTGDTEPDMVAVPESVLATGVAAAEVIAVEGVAEIDSSADGVALIVGTGGGTEAAEVGATDTVPVVVVAGVAMAVLVEAAVGVGGALGVPVPETVETGETVETTVMMPVGCLVPSEEGLVVWVAALLVVTAGVTTTVGELTMVTSIVGDTSMVGDASIVGLSLRVN